MSTPAWILEIFAAVMLLVAEVSAGQLVTARARTQRSIADVAVSRLLTGIAIAGILVPGLSILPDTAWEVAFAIMTGWFAWRLWRARGGRAAAAGRGHYAPPLVHSAAMLYMFAALAAPSVPGTGGMSGMGGWASSGLPTLHAPALALIFTLLLVAFAVHDLDRRADVDGSFRAAVRPLVPPGAAGAALAAAAAGRAPGAGPGTGSAPSPGPAARLLLSPAVVKGCQVATGVSMAFTLIMMI